MILVTIQPGEQEEAVCTYTTFSSNEDHATIKCPILILSNKRKDWAHHSCGFFSNQDKQTAFEFEEEDGTIISDILRIDARFVSLIKWLGENHIHVRLSGGKTHPKAIVYIRFVKLLLVAVRSCLRRMASYSL